MKLFACDGCGATVYFENDHCGTCGRDLGFRSSSGRILALAQNEGGGLAPAADGTEYRRCANHQVGGCNWLLPADSDEDYCLACRLNRTVPDLSNAEHCRLWRVLEAGKRRLLYGVLRLGLPLIPKSEDPARGLAFDFLADGFTGFQEGPQVMTGHAQGLITINIAEADPARREEFRQSMAEPYRTVLGHFRHEIGHYYWERLVRDTPWLEDFRRLFGDETVDYGTALQNHYQFGPTQDWQDRHVSAYASSHPWEDFAETWAHYLHMVDTLDTAYAFGLRLRPRHEGIPDPATAADFAPYREDRLERLWETWLPLTFAVNSLNRSMGQPDLYPFVLSPTALEKMDFVHRLIRQSALP